jgi:hypothetical protein
MLSNERTIIFRDPDCFKPIHGPLYNLGTLFRKVLRCPDKASTDKDPDLVLGPRFLVRVFKDRIYRRCETPYSVAQEEAHAWRTSQNGCWGCPAKSLVDSNGLRVCGGVIENRIYFVQEDDATVTYACPGYKRGIHPSKSDLSILRQGHCFTLPAQITEPLTSGEGSLTMSSYGPPLQTEVNT